MDSRNEEIQYTLVPTKLLNRMVAVLEKLEPKVQEEERWIKEEEAMKRLYCGKTKLYELRKDGKIKYRAIGGKKILIDAKSVESYNYQNSTL